MPLFLLPLADLTERKKKDRRNLVKKSDFSRILEKELYSRLESCRSLKIKEEEDTVGVQNATFSTVLGAGGHSFALSLSGSLIERPAL